MFEFDTIARKSVICFPLPLTAVTVRLAAKARDDESAIMAHATCKQILLKEVVQAAFVSEARSDGSVR